MPASPNLMDGSAAGLRRRLLRWYAAHARDLPWRRTRDPYRVWISEIMLQQTTVVAVVPYYERFLARFPHVAALAAAREEDVLKLWEGLGYYSRARNLWRAARQIVAGHGGQFPRTLDELRALPGIGRYTAGAIVSFAFDGRAPIVEANTLRLYARLLGYRGDPRSAEGQSALWNFAEQILPRREPGRFNQALLELGAAVCRPAEPDCAHCPLSRGCIALAAGAQHAIPLRAARPAVTDVVEAVVAVSKKGRLLVRKRTADERWAGLWDFPRFDVSSVGADGAVTAAARARLQRDLERRVRDLTGIEVEVGARVGEIRHSVTRFRIRLMCLEARHRGGRLRHTRDALRWVSPGELSELPLSTSGRRVAALLAARRAAARGELAGS